MNTVIFFAAKYLFLVIILLLLVFLIRLDKDSRRKAVLFSLLYLPVAFILSRIAGRLFYDPRPFVSGGFTPIISHAADNGFPSDHALLAFALATIAFTFNKKWGIGLLLLAVLVAMGRVFSGVHSTIDVVGSAGIDILAAMIISPIFRIIWKRIKKSEA
ncbi:MAG TPA: phosphatase PAP2 family protein, partial [Patescibacteria group bacterium]|nr:phosphatase PAP2 family protein [Patescibacteria group bacterium]